MVLLRDHVARTRPSVRAAPDRARRRAAAAHRRPHRPSRARPRDEPRRPRLDPRPAPRPAQRAHRLDPGRATPGRRSTAWRIAVRLSTRRVTVYRDGRVARRFRAVVGTASTPTPRGRFFIEEAVALSPVDLGGPFALATSARSNVLQEFDGGPGQIALHGTNGLSDPLGTAASHGCIRLSTGAITWLARRIGSGVPLRITR